MSITTRRLPTRDELRIWREYIETADALRSALGARLQSDSGLSSGDYTVLLALSEADGRQLRSSALAAQIGWERSRLSHHLGRMERRGLIAREDCPTDNRGAEIVLTAAGATVFEDSNGPHLRAIREVFVDALTPEQLAAAGEVASALRVHLTDQTDKSHDVPRPIADNPHMAPNDDGTERGARRRGLP